MAQCEKVLDNGERCSNQAIPGTSYCQGHRRIVFRRATETGRVDTAPLPPLTSGTESSPPTKPKTRPKQQNWQASPSAASQEPAFPGLQVDDARNILVAPQGVIWLQAEPPASQFDRLVRLMSFLSQALPLAGQIKILLQTEGAHYVLYLTPDQSNTESLSLFYDKASDATRLVNGRFYIGQDKTFVQYRDDGAPRGYDVPGFNAPENDNELLLVAHWGTQLLSLSAFTEVSLHDLCLHVTPVPGPAGQVPEMVYALAPSPLYPLLAKYFYAHHQHYKLARLQSSAGELILFEIAPRLDAPVGQVVPTFILDYLTRLPRVALLVPVHQTDDRSILLQWKYRYPLYLPHIADALSANETLLLIAEHYSNLSISPVPQFFDGDQLMDVHLPSSNVLHLSPLPANMPASLKLEVLLRPDNGPTPPIAALILTGQELSWLRRLLYLLPGEAFRDYALYQGEGLSILLGNSRPIEGLPFGIPLRRPGNRALFLPLRSRLLPDLPWSLLQESLAMKEGVYTFLTPSYRLDLAETLFAPLARVLVAEPHRPRVNVRMLVPASLPALTWTAPPAPLAEVSPNKPKKNSLFAWRDQTPPREPTRTAPQNAKLEEATLWREKA
ncbi:MAG TPA: hypothetical protein VGN34_15830, partial [Ktedonobacteraceae bacterium]